MPEPRVEYAVRIEKHLQNIGAKERVHIRLGNSKLATIVAGVVVAWLSFAKGQFSDYWIFAPVAVYAALAIVHEQVIRARTRSETAVEFYRKGIARIEDRWAGAGEPGERLRDPKHAYADDLDIFGRGCLFELLSTARLPMGENRLAQWLQSPSSTAEIIERQEFVAKLREKLDLREALAVTGQELRVRLDPESLVAWAKGGPVLPAGILRGVTAAFALLAAGTFVLYVATRTYWPVLSVLLAEAIVLWRLHRRAEAVLSGMDCNAEGLVLFSKILERIEAEQCISPRVRDFSAELMGGGKPASEAVRQLARIVTWADGRAGYLVKLLELPLLYTVQTALAAEAWRARFGARMSVWIDITGEMEALLSLAGYSFEHPGDPFPQIVERAGSEALFDGEELGHPLIPSAQCVRNSVTLDHRQRLLLVSGSNMSGKSTLLRVVGINTVLAMAGAPIRGKSLRLTPLALGTRLRSADSLQEGRSNFYTEILRIRQVSDLTKGGLPLLFLFDELLEGTNSNDRRIGAEGLLAALLGRGALGIVTTHDLALTEITQSLGESVRNWHFQDYVEEGKMRFDYKLREGVVAKSNALELMRLIGLQV